MKAEKYVISRSEIKYKLSYEQFCLVKKEVEARLPEDEYGETSIQSLYYDTNTFLLIRNSLEKPLYKEKIRARSYGIASPDKKIFLELKKKSNKVVFKRRISLKEIELSRFLQDENYKNDTQIAKEIKYFCKFYKDLKPSALLIYDRVAYHDINLDLRITFDKNIRYRTYDLNLCKGLYGEVILPNGEVMMEIKSVGAYPRWLIDLLNSNKIYKTSFSKYGKAYIKEMEKHKQENKTLTKEKAV